MLKTSVHITRRFYFSASHRYWIADWPAEKNEALFGKNIHQHGHNYVLDVTLAGPIDPQTGMILNLTEVKHLVNEILEKNYDHRNLNVDHPVFATALPTTERIAFQLASEIAPGIKPPVKLHRLRLWETEDLFAEIDWNL